MTLMGTARAPQSSPTTPQRIQKPGVAPRGGPKTAPHNTTTAPQPPPTALPPAPGPVTELRALNPPLLALSPPHGGRCGRSRGGGG